MYSPLYLFTPGFSFFRGQERWAMAVAFSLSVLVGYGVSQVATSKVAGNNTQVPPPAFTPRLTSRLSFLTSRLCLFSLLLTILFFFGLNDTGWTPASPFYKLLGGAILLALLSVLAWLLFKFGDRLHLAVFTGLTAVLVCFDLFTANWQTNLYPQPPEWHTQMPALVQAIKQDATATPNEPYRVYNEFRLYDNYGVPFAIEDLWGASPLRPDRYDKFLAPPMPIERTWELLNVKYVITWRQELYVPSTIIYQEPAADGTTYVHRLNQVGPRAWLVTQAETAADASILQKIADPNFDRWRIALLETGTNWQTSTTTNSINNSQFIIHYSLINPGRAVYQVTTPTPALLILSETYYPGWQARVDGQPVPLFRADYILRAVPVPAGEHTVELAFQPLSFTIGAIISGLTVIGLVAGLVVFTRRR